MTKKFHIMRLTDKGTLSPIAGIRGQDTVADLEGVIRGSHLRDTGNPIVIVEIVSTVKIETHINIQNLAPETLKKAGRSRSMEASPFK